MKTGDLKHRITIQQYVTGTNENGFPVDEWADFTTVWAAKRGLTGREYYAAAAVQAETDVVYTVRYSSTTAAVTNDMRIQEGTHTYDIKSISDKDGSKRWLEIHASEVVNGGS